jgi:hypothetical protein
MLDLLSRHVEAFYDFEREVLFVRADLSPDRRRASIVHELVHALQAQHFELGALSDATLGTDARSALLALVEGDAVWTTLRLIGDAEPFERAPSPAIPILVELLRAPYAAGHRFVERLIADGGLEELSRAFAAPPASTEQVLHWRNWEQRDAPRDVAVPPRPEPSAELVYSDVLGEQTLSIVLGELADAGADTGAGWSGDRAAAYRVGEHAWIAWRLVFDDGASAARAYQALARSGESGRTSPQDYGLVETLVDADEVIWVGTTDLEAGRSALAGWANLVSRHGRMPRTATPSP